MGIFFGAMDDTRTLMPLADRIIDHALAEDLAYGDPTTASVLPSPVRATGGVQTRQPIVMAGGKKIPELDALTMASKAVQEGAAGVDMGRNIFQSEAPTAMIQAVRAVVHKNEPPAKAFDLYQTLKRQAKP